MANKPIWVVKTENELKKYREYKANAELAEIDLESLFPNCIAVYSDAISNEQNKSQTEIYGLKRAERKKEAMKDAERARAIEAAIESLLEIEKNVIIRHFFDGQNLEDMGLYLNKEVRTLKNYKRSGVDKIAERLKFKPEK